MKKTILIIFLFILSLSIVQPAQAQPRLAECDACGYCQQKDPPENWEECVQCLYPDIVAEYPNPGDITAEDKRTLEILTDPNDPRQPDLNNPIINQPVQPERGKYFTQLGCIDTSLSSFQNPSAAGGVLNFVLTNLIFPTAGVLAFLSLLYGAFLLITAQGDSFQIARGKQFISGAIIGLIFTFAAVFLINAIGGNILRIPGVGDGT